LPGWSLGSPRGHGGLRRQNKIAAEIAVVALRFQLGDRCIGFGIVGERPQDDPIVVVTRNYDGLKTLFFQRDCQDGGGRRTPKGACLDHDRPLTGGLLGWGGLPARRNHSQQG
jgi:hypothetical protein